MEANGEQEKSSAHSRTGGLDDLATRQQRRIERRFVMFDRYQRVVIAADGQRHAAVRFSFDDSLNTRVSVEVFVCVFVAVGC